MFRVRAIQVEHGDSLLISYGDDKRPYHLLVDGGPLESKDTLRSVLEDACVDGSLHLEVLVITHFDLDHIEGVIELLTSVPSWLTIGDVWFNGYHHLTPPDMLGPAQGDTLSKLIRRLGLPWNKCFRKNDEDKEGGAILQSGNTLSLSGGLEVGVLSPDQEGLTALAGAWTNPDLPPEDSESPPGDLLGRGDRWPPYEFASDQTPFFRSDTSKANRSSIGLLLNFEGKRILLAADALSSVIEEGLQKHLSIGASIDLLKVSHHGSKGNTAKSLLALLRCSRFLICTSGKNHLHPDHALIERLVAGYTNPEIIFNYSQGWPGNWINKPGGWPPFRVRYPEDSNPFVDVLL